MALSISLTAFMAFLVNVKRQTYAAQGDDATVTPLQTASQHPGSSAFLVSRVTHGEVRGPL
jgi:hypothetical protein